MSGLLTVNGGYNGTNGLLPVPTNFTSALRGSSIAVALQNYLNTQSTALPAGGAGSFLIGFDNIDVPGSVTDSVSGSNAGALVDITNIDTNSVTTPVTLPASTGVAVAIPTITSALVVQDPERLSITGSSSTSVALFGGSSSVHYSVTGGQGSIFAGGGRDVIGIYSAGTNSNISLASSGNDSINLNGTGSDTVTAIGNATTNVLVGAANATVSATGSSIVDVVFSQNAGGDLDFINASSNTASVYSGSYGPGLFAPNSVTVFAGAGGGVYVGGRGGSNSLIGGSGLATLIGGGVNDILSVTASVGSSYNELYTGAGLESLIGGTGSGNNAFNIGLVDLGVGVVTAAGIASSNGSGVQAFDIGNTNGETITGSSVAGSHNVFDIVGDSTTGGGNFTINDFNSVNSTIYLVDGTTQAPGDASISGVATVFGSTSILLTDGTQITLKNYTGGLTTSTGSTGTVIV